MTRTPRIKLPLDHTGLEEIALAYVARYATSRARLEVYLRRKLRERGWEGEGDPPVKSTAGRMCEAGYVDDAAFARGRADSLLRRGYGPGRVGLALVAAGIDEQLRDEVRPGEAGQREAALTLLRRRGFGPFGATAPDQGSRQKQLAAMARAGHSFAHARALIDAPDVASAEHWAAQANGESEWD